MSDLDSLAFEPGQQVQCKTRYEEVYKGEVIAFDLNSNILILKSPSSVPSTTGVNTNHDLHCLVLDSVSEVNILEEPPQGKCNNDLPSLGTKYLNDKRASASKERLRLIEAVENGVSQDGISLFTAFSKKYDRPEDLMWKDKVKIIVMNSVVISPPYKESDCKPLYPDSSQSAVNYVKSNIRKFWESCSKQKQTATTNNAITSTTTTTATANTATNSERPNE